MMDKSAARGTRTGFTTGACAAAAARAATIGLVTGQVPASVECLLPNGSVVSFIVEDGRCDVAAGIAHAMVIKDAGDDPDCTDKAHLTADVLLLHDQAGVVELAGGFGVGTVTMQGLGLTVGGPAINPVPRKNIEANVRLVGGTLLDEVGLRVTISVPQGVEMAKKNPECATRHFGWYFDSWYHRYRQAIFHGGLPCQRGARGTSGKHLGPWHCGVDHGWQNREIRHGGIAAFTRCSLRSDGRFSALCDERGSQKRDTKSGDRRHDR